MRPKIILWTLVIAVGLVAVAAVLKAVVERAGGQAAKLPEPSTEPVPPAATNLTNRPSSTNAAGTLEQLQAADRRRELDQIRELQFDGASNPHTTGLLLGKLVHKDSEVRQAAVTALVHLGDTNVIPGMEEALGLVEDPREKVALMDAINYLKLLGAPSDSPFSTLPDTNGAVRPPRTIRPASQTTTTNARVAVRPPPRKDKARAGQSAIPSGAPAAQPASGAPGAAPPQ
jgi:hypothetical protein